MKNKRVCCMILCFIMAVVMLLPTQVMAAESIDTQAPTSLAITLAPEDIPAKNVEFRLYQVANVSEDGEFTYVGKFANYPISPVDDDPDAMRLLATTLLGFVVADSIAPNYMSNTNDEGIVGFEGLSTGLYLVFGGTYLEGTKYITPTPFLISLPDLDTENVWQYDVEVKTKHYDRPEGEPVTIEVQKNWDDDGNKDRPTQIEVELYDGFELYDTVVLNKGNNWKHTWTDLASSGMWIVKEKEVAEGYTVSVEQKGDLFVITNTNPGEPEPDLPQTGTLWWIVPILVAAGVVLVLVGLIRRRGAADGK